MKRILCLMLALLMLPVPAMGIEFATAAELNVQFLDNRTELDMPGLRDGSDATGYAPKAAKRFILSANIPEATPLYQLFLRMDAMPSAVEVQVKPGKEWETVLAVSDPGPEFLLRLHEAVTGDVRLIVRFSQNAKLELKELRLFASGNLPKSLHVWKSGTVADVLLAVDDLSQVDASLVAQLAEAGHSVAVGSLVTPKDGLLATLDALWEAGLRIMPGYGDMKAVDGDAQKKLKTWKEKPIVKQLTSWLRQYQPLLAVQGSEVIAGRMSAAMQNAYDYNYEIEDAAAHGLWIVPDTCAASEAAARAIAPRSDEALRAYCAQRYASDVHADPATIPYPAERLEDGYLAEGEFVHEDPENGLWAYLSPTVQVEIVKYTNDDPVRVYFITDVKFKPEQEQFKQVLWANASFKNQQIYPETLAQTANMVLAVNADYYPYRLDRGQPAGNILRSREVLYNNNGKKKTSFPNLDTMALTDDGRIEVFGGTEVTASSLLARGDVHDALSFGPYLVRDGKLRIYDGGSWSVNEPRNAIGMIEAGHYRIITVEGKMPKGGAQGLNVNDLAKLMYAQGVTDGFNLDGGSTSVLIFMGTKLNRTGKGNSIGKPRNQHELYGVGTSTLTHTDMIKTKK